MNTNIEFFGTYFGNLKNCRIKTICLNSEKKLFNMILKNDRPEIIGKLNNSSKKSHCRATNIQKVESV